MIEAVMDAETAELEFERFLELMDLKARCNESEMDEEDRKGFRYLKRTITDALRAGQAVVDEAGELTYTLKVGDQSITFREPTGECYLAIDRKRSGQDVAKSFEFLAAMTGTTVNTFRRMAQRDLAFAFAVEKIFLA